METAGEGGAWGMALLAAYMLRKEGNETLDDYLEQNVFSRAEGHTEYPVESDVKSFNRYLERYIKGLEIERSAIESMK